MHAMHDQTGEPGGDGGQMVGIKSATDVMLAGKVAMVAGYGDAANVWQNTFLVGQTELHGSEMAYNFLPVPSRPPRTRLGSAQLPY